MEEQLQAAQREVETLKGQLGVVTQERDAARTSLSGTIAKAGELEGRVGQLQGETETARTVAGQAQTESLGHLRRALIAENRDQVVEDLVQGQTADELVASIGRAKEAFGRATEMARQQLQQQQVPAGAPARDQNAGAEGLSPVQKIQRGLEQRASAS